MTERSAPPASAMASAQAIGGGLAPHLRKIPVEAARLAAYAYASVSGAVPIRSRKARARSRDIWNTATIVTASASTS